MEASLKDGDKKEQWRGLATSFKTKSSKSLERRRNKLEAQSKPDTRPRINYKEWFLIPLVSQVWNYLNQSDRLSLTGRSLSVKPYLGSGYSILSEPLMINKLIETLTSLIGNVIFISNSISHEDSNGSREGLTKEERTQAKGLVSLSKEGDDRLIRGSEDLILLVINLCQKILEETKGDRDEDLIFKLYLDSDIYHTYIQKKLTLAEVGSPSGRPRPACLPDPTKKRRISQTIDQELKLPKNESSSSGLDDQQTENATEETTLIPQIKKGVHKVLITSTPYTIHCALLLYIYSKVAIPKERKKEKKIKG
ncbi:hypothetical protein PPACK8108_LOCUS1633 [Phakopsora pachyrhizi]|uniref:Uncharacterized protein n=1 Tax=Phakopsora pachyrhizi TaxID=170000 RepID=A0AAV0AKA5_PHAPC|nr:hypothetical protein PPACK8108_LOCUS1633 [Phakopsora pachyrhizi]